MISSQPPRPAKVLPEHIVKFKAAINNFKENLRDARKKIFAEIRQFRREDLCKQPVYFANTNFERRNTFIPYAGFLVSGKPHPKTARDSGRIYSFFIDIMRAPYEVTPEVLAQSRRLDMPESLKQAVQELQGRKFAAVEYFLRELIEKHVEIEKKFISEEVMEYILQDPDEQLRNIIFLNYLCSKRAGSYAPAFSETRTFKEKLALFHAGKAVYTEANISIPGLLEVMHEQMLYYNYLDDKLGIGKSVSASEKSPRRNLDPACVQRLTGKWVQHMEFPKDNHQANCNSSTASLLQYAMNREQKRSTLTYQTVQTATLFAFSSNQRMYLHDPLLISECIAELREYIKNRNGYDDNFWGRLFKLTKRIKISAAEKMILLLQQRTTQDKLSADEHAALKQGKLKKIIEKYPQSLKLLNDWEKYNSSLPRAGEGPGMRVANNTHA